MKKGKLGQEPAFPFESKEYGNVGINETGMSKRFYAACEVTQGLLASNIIESINLQNKNGFKTEQLVASLAYTIADELLKQENL